jgi:HKD family nuclease
MMAGLLSNSNGQSHADSLRGGVSRSDDVFMAVAFLKCKGLEAIHAELRHLLEAGGRLTAVIGTDFCLTDPAAIVALDRLQEDFTDARLFLFDESPRSTFHPKYYRLRGTGHETLIVGSANLTGGGMETNCEVSVVSDITANPDLAEQARKYEQSLLDDRRCKRADWIAIQHYQSRHRVVDKAQRKAEKAAKKKLKDVKFLKGDLLHEYLKAYQASQKEREDLAARTANYQTARVLLDEIADTQDADRATFEERYGRLVGERSLGRLWHSDGLHRSKAAVIDQHEEVSAMVRDIRDHLDLDPAEMFALGDRYVQAIHKLGPNAMTEVCNTFRPDRFAVLNRNPLTSLQVLGLATFGDRLHFKPEDYAEYCRIMTRLRDECGFADLGKTDHFLNFIYWQEKEK